MTLLDLVNLIKRFTPWLLAIFSVLFILLSIINLKTFQEKTRLGQSPLPKNLEFGFSNNLSPTGVYGLAANAKIKKPLPQKVDLYEADLTLSTAEVDKLANKLGVAAPMTKDGGLMVYKQGETVLTYDANLNLLTFSKSPTGPNIQTTFTGADIQKAKDFIKDFLKADLAFTGITYLSGGVHAVIVSERGASFAALHFQVKVNDTTIAEDNMIVIGKNADIAILQVHPMTNIKKRDSYPAKNINEIVADLQNYQFQLQFIAETQDLAGKVISNATFDSIQLDYVTQPKQGLVQPVYTLRGTATIDGQKENVKATVAAIKGVGLK